MKLLFIIPFLFLLKFKIINCQDDWKLIYKFPNEYPIDLYINKCLAQYSFDKIILYCFGFAETHILKYNKDTDEKSSENKSYDYKREYYNSDQYIGLLYEHKSTIYISALLYYYNNEEEIKIEYVASNAESSFIILKDKSLIFATISLYIYKSEDHISLCKYNYPSFTNKICNKYFSKVLDFTKLRQDYNLIDCSNKIFLIYQEYDIIRVLIFDSSLNDYFSSHDIISDKSSSNKFIEITHLDKKKESLILCTLIFIDATKNFICLDLRFQNNGIIVGKYLTIFSKDYFSFNMALLEDNKIAIAFTGPIKYSDKSFVYFSTLIYENGSLKFGAFNNKKIYKINGEENMSPALVFNNHYGLFLYLITEKSGMVYELNLFGYCNSFNIDNIEPYSKNLINFENHIFEGIDETIGELYIYTENKNVNIFRGSKNEYLNSKFNINDKIYISCEDSENQIILFYGFNNKK